MLGFGGAARVGLVPPRGGQKGEGGSGGVGVAEPRFPSLLLIFFFFLGGVLVLLLLW